VETYEVKTEPHRVSPKRKIIAALCFGAFFFVFLFGASVFFPTPGQTNMGLASRAMEIGIPSLLAALITALTAFLRPASVLSYKLLVDEESMTGVSERTGWMSWFVIRKKVRKSKVRTIFQIKANAYQRGGLAVSERSMFGARMLGCVFLPMELPEYDKLRRLVESWRSV